MNRNSTIRYTVTTGTGEFSEKCRNSIGGYANMITRIEERLGRFATFTALGERAATFTTATDAGWITEVAR